MRGTPVSSIPVLTSGDAVEIDYDLQTVIPCPCDGLEEIFVLPLNIRLAGSDFVGPITYGDAHVIESEEYECIFIVQSCGVLQRRTQPPQSTESQPR